MRFRSALPTLAVGMALVLAGCGDQPSDGTQGSADEPTSSPNASPSDPGSTAAATEIPDDFPLTRGMGDDVPASRTGTGLRDITLCGVSPLRGLGIRDRLTADNSGGESANTRELVLLGNPDEPQLVAQAFSDLVLDCDEPDVQGDMTTTTEVRESPYGPSPAATLLQTYDFGGEPGTGATIIQVVPVGSALLVSSTYADWTGVDPEAVVADRVDALSGAVEAMAIFSDGTSPVPSPTTSPTESATSQPGLEVIPEDFPLALGMQEDGGDFDRSDPSRDTDRVGEVAICGRVVWPLEGAAGGTDRLVTHVEGPEYYDGRELIAYADSEVALNAMAPIRRAAQDCRDIDERVWTPLEADTGYDSVTMGLTYTEGLGSSVFQFTRVGSAILLVTTYGEGSLESLPRQAREVTGITEQIAPAMCAFSETGC